LKPYTVFTLNSFTTEQRVGTNVTTSISSATSGRQTLANVLSVNGNRKDPNPQTFDKVRDDYLSGVDKTGTTTNQNYTLVTGNLGRSSLPSVLPSSFSSVAYNQALERLYSQLRGDIDLSIDLLQHKQTTSMIKSAVGVLGSLPKVVASIKHQPTKVASNLWLQWVYGVKPTMSTIYDTCQLFNATPRRGIYRLKGKGRDEATRVISWYALGDTNLLAKTSEQANYRAIVCCDFDINPSVINNLSQLTSLNPISIAWELVPYSFVVDWFFDVGQYLRNLESALFSRSAFVRGYVTQGVRIEGLTEVLGSYVSGFNTRHVDAQGGYRVTRKSRILLSSSPMPRLPSIKVDLGSSRILSAVSLTRQKLRL